MDELLRLLAAGLIGGVLGPVTLEEYRPWRRDRARKKLRTELLSEDSVFHALNRTTGTTPEGWRSLPIESILPHARRVH